MERRILVAVRDAGRAEFPEVNEAVPGTTEAVFRACKDLEREGKLRTSLPGVFELTDAGRERLVALESSADDRWIWMGETGADASLDIEDLL